MTNSATLRANKKPFSTNGCFRTKIPSTKGPKAPDPQQTFIPNLLRKSKIRDKARQTRDKPKQIRTNPKHIRDKAQHMRSLSDSLLSFRVVRVVRGSSLPLISGSKISKK